LLSTLAPLLLAQGAFGQNDTIAVGCTNRTLTGLYGFTISGTAPSGPEGPAERVVGLAMSLFDGAGNFTQTDWVHGEISGAVADRTGWGSYDLNRDCSGTMSLNVQDLPFTVELRIVVVDRGDQIETVVMAPAPNLITSSGKRIR
jgi:hypothetical protein